jgi:hypothetical protein
LRVITGRFACVLLIATSFGPASSAADLPARWSRLRRKHFRKSNPWPLNNGAAFYLLMSLAKCRLLADFVAKVENRTTAKIARKSISIPLCRRNALWRRYEGPWSILGETTWSLTSPHTMRISGPKNL